MFERPVPQELDAVACADVLAGLVAEQRLVGARRLAYAAHWADLHGPTPQDVTDGCTHSRPATRIRFRPGGSDGTPEVSEFAADELGALLEMTTVSGANLIADALDLRHRHPRLWDAVLTGRVEDWKARKVVHATAAAGLSLDRARRVDEETVDAVVGLPFSRALTVVEARVLAADPEQAEELRRIEEQRRYVSVGRSRAHGLRTLIARTTAGEVARLDAMIAHVAELLQAAGDTDVIGVRRAKALGVLANPAQACLLLASAHGEATEEPEPGAVPDAMPDAVPTAVEIGVVFGHVLAGLGADAWTRLRPRTVLYLHVAEEAVRGTVPAGECPVRVEGPGPAAGPISTLQLKEWLANDQVVVKPVLDPLGQTPVDAHEIPERHREASILLNPFEVFPFGTRPARGADLDHNRPYRERKPGQTGPDNLGPLGRGHHRAKTIGGFSLHQPLPGMYLWRTPTGHWFQVDHLGTRSLGRTTPDIITQLTAPVRMSRMDLIFSRLIAA
jgi:hypothetical protein